LIWLLWEAGLSPVAAYRFTPTAPLGVPQVISIAFWGGLWGIAWAWLAGHLRGGRLGFAVLFGAILPTLVAAAVVTPLKGGDPKIFMSPAILVFALAVNGAWGFGTELFLRLGRGRVW